MQGADHGSGVAADRVGMGRGVGTIRPGVARCSPCHTPLPPPVPPSLTPARVRARSNECFWGLRPPGEVAAPPKGGAAILIPVWPPRPPPMTGVPLARHPALEGPRPRGEQSGLFICWHVGRGVA